MSETPRTDAARMTLQYVGGPPLEYVQADFARTLERELDEATMQASLNADDHIALVAAHERIRSLEMDVAEIKRPLDAEMGRLNQNLIAANERALAAEVKANALRAEIERLRANIDTAERRLSESTIEAIRQGSKMRAEIERLTSAGRRAVVALAHASEAMPQYAADYQAISDALAQKTTT